MDPKTEEQDVPSPSPDHAQEHPEQEAHGGSMAPGLVDDTGNQTADLPDTTPDQ